jgi:hypothetical protein
VVKYHGLARRYLTPPRFLMRPLLNGDTLGGRQTMRSDLDDLIDRMARLDQGVSSSQSISWAAHREAERLDDPSLVGELLSALQHERSKPRRRACYFVIGKIGLNRQDVLCAEALVALLASESDKYNLAAILDGIGPIRKPPSLDLFPVFRFLDDARWLVRHAAIQALTNSEHRDVETRLLQHLAHTEEPNDKVYCHAVLNHLGTAQSIPALTANLTSRKRDVKISAELALQAIRSRGSG